MTNTVEITHIQTNNILKKFWDSSDSEKVKEIVFNMGKYAEDFSLMGNRDRDTRELVLFCYRKGQLDQLCRWIKELDAGEYSVVMGKSLKEDDTLVISM